MVIDMSLGDARRDYQGTVVMYNGVPILVVNIDDDFVVTVRSLTGSKDKLITKEALFATKAPERLGMVNTEGGNAVFVSRIPFRRYQMGVSSHNAKVDTIGRSRAPSRIGSSAFYSSPDMANTILGIYPKFAEALKTARQNGMIVAFDRQLAVSREQLFYKHEVVGSVGVEVNSFLDINFAKKFEYVKNLYKGV